MTPQLTFKINGVLVRHSLQNLSEEIPQVSRLVIYRLSQRIQQRMKKSGARPSHPIMWVSAKQRKAFFASDGFDGGIPHRRTGRYVDAWKVIRIDEIGYRILNASKGAKFIGGDAYGENQSPIHAGRWPLFRNEAEDELKSLPSDIAREISIVARRHGLSK
jgi:hypothetical protein